MEKNKGSPHPQLATFVNGLEKDLTAVTNSLRYKYNNGLLEGSVNKLKSIKRIMYDRADYSLVRAKILLTN